MKINFKQYGLYLFRWQLSTPIIAIVFIILAEMNKWFATIIANFLGGLIFYWIDKYIFKYKSLNSEWAVKENITCSDCGKISRGYRLIKTKNYDKSNDPTPKFRCEKCSKKKTKELIKKGIEI